jgi:ribonuclease T2
VKDAPRFPQPNPVRARPLIAAALFALACVCAAGVTAARHRHDVGGGIPGDFDYYLLSLSWSPAYCLESPQATECVGPRRYGLLVHGLWPQSDLGSPEHCNAHRAVPNDVVLGIADLMPVRSLVYHEWSAHGTCSGLAPAAFFSLVRRAYESVVIPMPLAHPTAATEQSTGSLVGALVRANPGFPAQSLFVTCTRQDAPLLREVRVCLDRNLAPRACSGEALRGACRAPRLIVPPVR